MSDQNSTIINALPTKEFFIYTLIRDIKLIDAIPDLVDNSIDGARRIRPNNDFSGLWVRIEANNEHFKIADNCGGISVDVARNYAFRFGRPVDMPDTPHSVGQFGVGMKRALFKIGNKFKVESTTENSLFVMEQDMRDWIIKPEWQFEFNSIEENGADIPLEDTGTTITVEELHSNVSSSFELENFQTALVKELESKHLESISQGLSITFNGTPLNIKPLELLQSDSVKPAFATFNVPNRPEVSVKIYAGLGPRDPNAAGWYVFCNGRLVLEADKSTTTGWKDDTPGFHNTYARFRGYVFFDSDVSKLLPWTTTKNGVDADSDVFRSVRLEMIRMMQPVISFLRELDKERVDSAEEADETDLATAVETASEVKLAAVRTNITFTAPKYVPVSRPKVANILYSKPKEEVDRVMNCLKVNTYKDVGIKTFDYYFKMECDE